MACLPSRASPSQTRSDTVADSGAGHDGSPSHLITPQIVWACAAIVFHFRRPVPLLSCHLRGTVVGYPAVAGGRNLTGPLVFRGRDRGSQPSGERNTRNMTARQRRTRHPGGPVTCGSTGTMPPSTPATVVTKCRDRSRCNASCFWAGTTAGRRDRFQVRIHVSRVRLLQGWLRIEDNHPVHFKPPYSSDMVYIQPPVPELCLAKPVSPRFSTRQMPSNGRHADKTTFGKPKRRARSERRRPGRVARLDGPEFAEHAVQCQEHLREGKLLSDADSRAAREGDILPPTGSRQQAQPSERPDRNSRNPQFLPPLWLELVGVFSVDILPPMHGIGRVACRRALGQ